MQKLNLCIVEGKRHCEVWAFYFSSVRTGARASFGLMDFPVVNLTSCVFIAEKQPDESLHLKKNRYIVNLFTQDHSVHCGDLASEIVRVIVI